MKTVLFSALVASAAAFAPSQQNAGVRSSALSAASPFANEIGAQAPLGFWDPLNVLEDATPERFEILRHIELKHGRVAMLAVTGYLVTAAGIRFPGAEKVPAGIEAFANVPKPILAQMLAFFAVAEIVNRDRFGKGEFLGDYRNGALDFGWDKQSDEWKRKKRATELNNGRAAMMGITGLVTHEMMGNLDLILPLKN